MNEKTLAKDELIGLQVKIKDCTDPNWNEKVGLIIDETQKTFLIKIHDKKKMIAKKTARFEFEINNKKLTLDGSKLVYRPADRIKKIR